MIALERVADVQVRVGFEKIDDRLLGFLRLDGLGDLFLSERRDTQHVEDEHAVVRHDRTAALGNDRRMLDTCIVAHRLNVVDDVVRILFQRVIHARFKVGLRTIVIDAQAASNIQVLEAGACL